MSRETDYLIQNNTDVCWASDQYLLIHIVRTTCKERKAKNVAKQFRSRCSSHFLIGLCLLISIVAVPLPTAWAADLVHDDFNGSTLSPIWRVHSGDATVKGGWVILSSPTRGNQGAYIVTGEHGTWSDYRLTTRVFMEGRPDIPLYLAPIKVRTQNISGSNRGTYYEVELASRLWEDGGPLVTLVKCVNDQVSFPNGVYHPPAGVINDYDNKVDVEVVGARIKVWVNDQPMIDYTDTTANPIMTGGVSLGALWDSTSRYDYVYVQDLARGGFSSFSPRANLQFGAKSNDDSFDLQAAFSLGKTSNGIDPLTENVSFKFGQFSLSIPSGSFQPDGKGGFTFAGSINQVSLQAGILPSSLQARGQPTPMWATDPTYRFFVNATGANLDGTTVPETASLSIGDDFGQGTLGVGKAALATVGDCSSSLRSVALCVSSSSNRSNPITLDGATLNGLVYVFTQPSSGVKQVKFWFGNDPTLPPTKLEKSAPFDFAGTVANGTAYPFDTSKLSKGLHAISAQVTLGDGTVQDIVKGTFTVK